MSLVLSIFDINNGEKISLIGDGGVTHINDGCCSKQYRWLAYKVKPTTIFHSLIMVAYKINPYTSTSPLDRVGFVAAQIIHTAVKEGN